MKDRIINISFPFNEERQMYKEETILFYKYYVAIPGLTKDDLFIKFIIEENFATILVDIEKSNTFVKEGRVLIVNLLEDIKHEKDEIQVLVDKGVLEIIVPKTKPKLEYTL